MPAKFNEYLLCVCYALDSGLYNGEQEIVFALKEFSNHRIIKKLLRPFSKIIYAINHPECMALCVELEIQRTLMTLFCPQGRDLTNQ